MKLLRECEIAEIIGVTPKTVNNWRNLKKGPPWIRISGNCVRYREPDLTAWIEARIIVPDGKQNR